MKKKSKRVNQLLKNVWVKNFPNNFYWFSVFLTFYSAELKCDMNFAVYVPPQAASAKVPVLYWLSGNCKCLQLIYCYWDCAEQSPEALTSYQVLLLDHLEKTFKSDSLIPGSINRD